MKTLRQRFGFVLLSLVWLHGCATTVSTNTADAGTDMDASTMNDGGSNPPPGREFLSGSELLVDVDWVRSQLDDPQFQLIDVRSAAQYNQGHIPGALQLDQGDLRTTVDGVNGQVASPETVQEVMRAAGLQNGTTVVVYSDGIDTASARVVWTLAYHQHGDVRLLDGGFDAWESSGAEVQSGDSSAPATLYAVQERDASLSADADWIAERLPGAANEDTNLVLIDARSQSEYNSGHIPTARLVEWTNNLSSGAMRPEAEVSALYPGVAPTDRFVVYCASGSRASVAWFVLRWLGFEDARLYDGSWNEWGSRSDLPVEN